MASERAAFLPIDFRTRFPALDGLRALAVTMVFLEHYAGGAHGGRLMHLVNAVRLRGWMGVDLFFVLSGFLITGILYDTRHDPRYFRQFFARRGLRLFPVLALVAVLLLALTPFVHYGWRAGQLWFLVYLGNVAGAIDPSLYTVVSVDHPNFTVSISHLWSLCVEEQFYLLWPAAVWWVRDRMRLVWLAGALPALALALRCALLWSAGPVLAERWIMRTLPFRADALLAGALLALLLRGPQAGRWQRACKPLFWAASAALVTLCVAAPAYDAGWLLTLGVSLVALAGAGLVGSVLPADAWPARLFSLRPLRTLGRYSYGFYVYHLLFRAAWIQLLIYLAVRLHSVALAGILTLGCNFLVTFLVARLSFETVERRFLRLKQRFAYDLEYAPPDRGPQG